MTIEYETLIDEFFLQYANRVNKVLAGGTVDVDGVVASFADDFIEASPVGIVAGKNDEHFKKAIPEGWGFYKKIGIQSMDILSTEITRLDDLHAMVRVHWNCAYKKKDNTQGEITFDVIYLVQMKNESLKIFAYITGDEQKALQEHGLLTS